MTKTPPGLKADERSLCLKLNVNDKIWEIPALGATLEVNNPTAGFDLEIKELESEIQKIKQSRVGSGVQ